MVSYHVPGNTSNKRNRERRGLYTYPRCCDTVMLRVRYTTRRGGEVKSFPVGWFCEQCRTLKVEEGINAPYCQPKMDCVIDGCKNDGTTRIERFPNEVWVCQQHLKDEKCQDTLNKKLGCKLEKYLRKQTG